MSTNREKVRDIFDQARRLPKPERATFLNGLTEIDGPMRAQIDDLLAALDEAGPFLSEPTQASGDSAPTVDYASAATMAAPIREGPGTRIGPYKLLQLIGEGGFGSVFMAEQEKPVQRKVALKIIKLGMDTQQVVARFEQERQALAVLDHPNIAKVFDAGATETGRPYFVMELVKGEPLAEYADKHNLSIEDRLELFAQVCTAVQHAHTKGIIHRDLKPGNVLVSSQDGKPSAKVIDFGIAKATASKLTEKTLFTELRQLIGTPEYMSPEQAEGSLDIDTRTDVYALGVMLYELLTGTTPFSSSELRSAAYAEMQRIIREVEPPKPSTRLSQNIDTIACVAAKRHTEPKRLGAIVRGDLDWIVMKALEKDRQRRYETANGLGMDIKRYLSGEAVLAAPPSTSYRFKKLIRRNKGPVAAGLVVSTVLVLGLIGTSVGLFRAERARAGEAEQRVLADVARAEAQRQEAEAIKQAQQAKAQEAEAKKQAAIADAVAKFQSDMLAAVDPNQFPKDPVTNAPLKDSVTVVQAMAAAMKVLDNGSLKDQPLVEARVRATIGTTLHALGRFDDAEQNLRKSLALYRESHPAGHLDIAHSLNALALLLHARNKIVEAEPIYLEALDITRKVLPAGHPSIAAGVNNLAGLLKGQNKLADAEPLFREALEIARAAHPPGHADIAAAINNLAGLLRAQNKLADAEPLVRESLDMRRAALPAGHPGIAFSLNNFAVLLQDQNKLAEAEPLLRESLEIWQRALPAGHPGIAHGQNNLAALYWRKGELDKSIPLFEESLQSLEKALGRQHPDTLSTAASLGVNYTDAGRLAEAIPLLEEAYEASKREPSIAWTGPRLLEAYSQAIDPAIPESVVRVNTLKQELLAEARARLSVDSPEMAGLLAAVGQALLALEAWEDAVPVLREALTIREKAQPDAWATFNTRSMLGAALLGQNNLTKAEPLLLEGYTGMKNRERLIPPQARFRIPESLERLVKLYEAKGNEPEAAAWRGKLEAARAEQTKHETETKTDGK